MWQRAWVMWAWMCLCLPLRLMVKGVAGHSKSQRLLARPAATLCCVFLSVRLFTACCFASDWGNPLAVCSVCWNETSQWFRRLSLRPCTQTFPWSLCLFTRVWHIYSSLIAPHSHVSVLQMQTDTFFDSHLLLLKRAICFSTKKDLWTLYKIK